MMGTEQNHVLKKIISGTKMAPFRGSILSPYDPKITSKTSILDFKGVDSSEREDLFGLGEVSKRQQYLWNAF